jgi:hypothetical protein
MENSGKKTGKYLGLHPRQSGLSRRDMLKQASLGALLYLAWSSSPQIARAADAAFPWGLVLPVLLPIRVDDPQATFAAIAKSIDGELDARMPDLKGGLIKDLAGLINQSAPATGNIIKALHKIEASPDFPKLRAVAFRHCFRHPAIWKALGYEGSSVEYGGYLERGFNDISWL